MPSPFRTVVETGSYIASASELFDDAQRDAIILELSANPMVGDVIPGTGGIRKVRAPASGRGKRGGARVIYFVAPKEGPVYLLMVFAKNAQTDLTPRQKSFLAGLVESIDGKKR
jgi:hypothetical protein